MAGLKLHKVIMSPWSVAESEGSNGCEGRVVRQVASPGFCKELSLQGATVTLLWGIASKQPCELVLMGWLMRDPEA